MVGERAGERLSWRKVMLADYLSLRRGWEVTVDRRSRYGDNPSS